MRVEAYPDLRLTGAVTLVGTLAQEERERRGAKDFSVTVQVNESEPRLRPGMTARVEIEVEEPRPPSRTSAVRPGPDAPRSIGFVFQAFHLIPQLTVAENVETPLLYEGAPPAAWRPRALRALERVGLAARADHRPTELSGGEAQRAAIARALVTEPRLLLADEPTGNLDSATGEEIAGLLDELHARGRTIVIVTHNEALARRAERVVRLRDGRVESEKRP